MKYAFNGKKTTLIPPIRAVSIFQFPVCSIQVRCISKLSAINRSLRQESGPLPVSKAKHASRRSTSRNPISRQQQQPTSGFPTSDRPFYRRDGRPNLKPDALWKSVDKSKLPPRFAVRQGEVGDKYWQERQNLPQLGPQAPVSRVERRERAQRMSNKRVLLNDLDQKREENSTHFLPKPPYLRKKPQQTPWKGTDSGPRYEADSVSLSSAASTFIFGQRLVTAALTSQRRKIYALSLIEPVHRDKFTELRRLASSMSIPIASVNKKTATAMAKLINNNSLLDDNPFVNDGVFLEVSPLPLPPLRSLCSYKRNEGIFSLSLGHQSAEDMAINGTSNTAVYNDSDWRAPFLLWLHGVVDVRNVGAIFRTALFMGADGIILSSRGTASLNNGVLKTSTGATEYLPAYTAPEDIDSFIRTSQANGWKFYGAVAPAPSGRPVRDALYTRDIHRSPAIDHPCVLVLGNEDEGLESRFVKKLDGKVCIAGSAVGITAGIDSLNVSNAAALLAERFLARPPDHRRNGAASSGARAQASRLWD